MTNEAQNAQVEDAIISPLLREWERLKRREVELQRLVCMGTAEAMVHLPNVAEYVATLERRLEERSESLGVEIDKLLGNKRCTESLMSEASVRIEELRNERDEEKNIVDRVWKAIGCETYADAKGKTIDELVAAVLAERDSLREALVLILPMAKGYAHNNDVGNNRKFIEQAESALTDMKP